MTKKIYTFIIALIALTPTLVIYNSCTSDDAQSQGGPGGAGDASVVREKTLILQEGLLGYDGTRDTTLFVDNDVWTDLGFTGTAPTSDKFGARYESGESNSYRALGLLKFIMSNPTSGMLKAGENCNDDITVARAELRVFGRFDNNTFVQIQTMQTDSPEWLEDEATYTEYSAGNLWPIDNGRPDQPVMNHARLGDFDAREGVPNAGIARSWYFAVNTEIVKEWICDGSKNHGFLVEVTGGADSQATVFSSEFGAQHYRPMLTVVLVSQP